MKMCLIQPFTTECIVEANDKERKDFGKRGHLVTWSILVPLGYTGSGANDKPKNSLTMNTMEYSSNISRKRITYYFESSVPTQDSGCCHLNTGLYKCHSELEGLVDRITKQSVMATRLMWETFLLFASFACRPAFCYGKSLIFVLLSRVAHRSLWHKSHPFFGQFVSFLQTLIFHWCAPILVAVTQ